MGKQNLRTIVESIVIEALEEWMDECEACDDLAEADKIAGEKAFGGGSPEKKPKKSKKA